MSPYRIPFNRATLLGNELRHIAAAVESGHLAGDGDFTRLCSETLERETGAKKVFLTTSCTHALEMTALLLDLVPGDEVLVPSFAFVTTVNAYVLRGAKPVFIDVRPDTLNLDETLLERHITPRTKAIVALHYAGVGCEMDAIMELARRHGLAVIEDNAHGLFGEYRGRKLGSIGDFATQSFHETKNLTCGEGGALLINDESAIERAEIVREKGTDRSRFFRGQVDKYSWVDIGSSYLPSEVLAAFLYAQLEGRETIQAGRASIWHRYEEGIADWATEHGVTMPSVPEHCTQPYHMFYLLMPSLDVRTRFIDYLKAKDILTVFHYLPLHVSEMGRRFGGKPGDCPVTEDISERLVRLPLFHGLSETDQGEVIEAIESFDDF